MFAFMHNRTDTINIRQNSQKLDCTVLVKNVACPVTQEHVHSCASYIIFLYTLDPSHNEIILLCATQT